MSSIHQNSSFNEDDTYDLTPELLRPVTMPAPNHLFYPLGHHQEEFREMHRRGWSPKYSLNMLQDAGNDPPPHHLSVILKCAILGSPLQRLTLREIRIAMCRRFLHYSASPSIGWCNTIRHDLSIKRGEFKREPRVKTSDDSGDWWKVVPGAELREQDLAPVTSRSRRAPPVAGSSNRSRGQGFPNQSRKKKVDPWASMTSRFTASEDQDFYAQYGNDTILQHPTGSQLPTSTQSSYRSPPGTSVGVSREVLPGIRSLGLPGLGTGSGGGQSHQIHQMQIFTTDNNHYYHSQNPSDRGNEENEENFYGEESEEENE